MKIDKLKEIILLLILFILIIFLFKYLNVLYYFKIIISILIPLFIGFVYAWIFNPLIRYLSRKLNRNISCIIVFLLFIMFFLGFIYFFIPMFYREFMEFIDLLPKYYNKLELKIEILGFREYLDKIISFIVNNVPTYLISFITVFFKYLGVTVIGIILGLYISFDYERIVSGIFYIVPSNYKCFVINLCQEISCAVRKCVNGTLLVALFVFILNSLYFLVIGLDSAFLLGFICGITDLIPYVGPYIGGFIAVLVGFTESKFLGVLVLIGVFVVQSIENYVLQPLVMSKSIKISPILVIVFLLLFGRLFGIFGMIISTPVLAMLKVFFVKVKYVLKKCKKDKLDFKY